MRCDRRRRSLRPRPWPSAAYIGRLSVRVPQLEHEEVALLAEQTVFKGAVEAHPERSLDVCPGEYPPTRVASRASGAVGLVLDLS
jgi:hypothetical protein